jgi:uroporphyrin-III C-methyltransferase
MWTRPDRARPGHVYLVGAGPGDPGLLTVKAQGLLETCNCVLHDHLADARVIALARSAERIDVGKLGHGPQVAQAEIERRLVARAREGRGVVRLKGGRPTVFGRAGEEAEALRAAGVPYEIVPGVSSALAAPAYAGIPVTRRGVASSLAIVTGRCAPADRSPLAAVAHADTLVILMGARALPRLTRELLEAGRAPHTPAAFVSQGTRPEQRTVRATLATLADAVRRSGAGAPGVIVVGAVAALSERLAWFAAAADETPVAHEAAEATFP